MTSWTPEPWAVGGGPPYTKGAVCIRCGCGCDLVLAECWPMRGVEANARRIVAAVNATAGIPTEDLEAMVNPSQEVFEAAIARQQARNEPRLARLAAAEDFLRSYAARQQNTEDARTGLTYEVNAFLEGSKP